MWTPVTRQHSRDHLRYETDLTDAEWALIEPLIPKRKARDQPRAWPLREILNSNFFCRAAAWLGGSFPLGTILHIDWRSGRAGEDGRSIEGTQFGLRPPR